MPTLKRFTVDLDIDIDANLMLMRSLLKAGAEMEDVSAPRTVFRHPSGKTIQELILEYLTEHRATTKAVLRIHLTSLGFADNSMSGALSELKKAGKISTVADIVDLPF